LKKTRSGAGARLEAEIAAVEPTGLVWLGADQHAPRIHPPRRARMTTRKERFVADLRAAAKRRSSL
jgi:hypothetical protein